MDNRQQSPSRALKITPILGLAILCLLSLQALLAQSSGDAHVSSFNNAGNSAPSNTASNPVAAPTPPTPNPTPNPTPDPNQIDTDGDGVPDVQDGWPKCNALAPAVLPIPYYVLVEIGEAGTWGTDINNSGHALITNGYAGDAWFWDGSNSIPLQTSGSVLGLLNDNDYYFDSGSGEIYYMSGVMCNLQVPQGFKDDWHVDEWEMLTLHYGETLSGPRYPSYGVSACFISIAGNAYGSVSGFARINWKSWCQLNAFQGCIWNNSGTNDPNFRS